MLNTSKATNVVLPPVSEATFDVGVSSLEPQFVRVRAPNNGFIYLDSKIRDESLSQSILSSKDNTIILAAKIRRLGVATISMLYDTPNVNERNNQISFYVQGEGFLTATITEGYYLTETAYMDALVIAMSAVAIANFTYTFAALSQNKQATINSTLGELWGFVQDDFLERNRYMFGPPLFDDPILPPSAPLLQPAWQVGSIELIYSRYIDFTSKVVTEYAKALSSSNDDAVVNTMVRLYFDDINPRTINADVDHVRWINFERNRQLTNVDITAFDEWNNFFYFPQRNQGDKKNQDWTLNIITEL